LTHRYIVEVQRGQQIKLIQAVSDSEFDEYYWKDLIFFITFPSHYCSAKPTKNMKFQSELLIKKVSNYFENNSILKISK